MNMVKGLLSLLGVMTALTYLFGRSFYNGWLGYWGLEPSLFKTSIEETLLYGYVSYTRMYQYLVFFILLGLIIFVFWKIIRRISKTQTYRKTIHKLSELNIMTRIRGNSGSSDSVSVAIKKCIYYCCLLVFLTISISLIYLEANVKGYRDGKAFHTRLEHASSYRPASTFETKSGKTYIGLIIKCGSNHCAILSMVEGGSSEVVLLPIESITSATYLATKRSNRDDFEEFWIRMRSL